MSQYTAITRRRMLQSSAAMTAMFAAWRASPAFAEGASLNILNSNTLWAEALTGVIADAYDSATLEGEANPYESHYEKMLIEMRVKSVKCWIIFLDAAPLRWF